MADYLTTDTELTSIANAIRTKGGTSAALTYPAEFVSAIAAIPTGGGGEEAPESDVNFIDYDGKIVASRTKAQINAMTSDSDLPENPTHDGLTSQGWNWTVTQLKAQLTAMPDDKVWVGQMYTTVSGATEIDVKFVHPERLSPMLSLYATNGKTVTIDWGDGTSDTATGQGFTNITNTTHTYANTGEYTIKISIADGTYRLGGGMQYGILRKTNSAEENKIFSCAIKRVRIGTNCELGSYPFYFCFNVEYITIPNTTTTIGTATFKYCISLKGMTIPKGATLIDTSTFEYCTAIERISLPSTITNLQYASLFAYCYKLKEITIPSGITQLGTYMFQANYVKEEFEFPSGITSIPNNFLYDCDNIVKITIPSTVTSMGTSAFGNCQGMKEYHLQPTTPPTMTNKNTFNNIPDDCIIYVPRGKLNDYKTESVWSNYASHMQEEPA